MPERAPSARAQLALWVAGVVLYSTYAWAWPFVFADEGYLYYLAGAVAEGQAPLRDFHLQSYMPGLFYAFSGPVSLAGGSLLLPRLAMVPWLALTPVLGWRCASRVASPPFAGAVAAVLLLVPGPWTKFYVAGLSLLALEAVFDLVERPGLRVAARAGGVVGLCLGLRIDVALAAAVLVLLALLRGPGGRWARLGACAAGAALAWSPFLLLMAGQGVVTEHLRQLAGFFPNLAWRFRRDTTLAPPDLPLAGGFPPDPFAILFYASLLCLPALAVALARETAGEGALPARQILFVWAALSAPAYAWERPDVPHLTQRAFGFLLPLAVIADQAWRRRADRRWRWPALAAVTGCALVACGYLVFAVGRAEGGSGSALWLPRREVRLSNGMSFWMAPHALPPELLERLLQRTRPREPVATLPYCPGVNFLTRRPMPGRYVFLVPHVVTSPEVERRYQSELARARYVVYVPGQTLTNTARGLLPAYAPAVARRLGEDFDVEMEKDGFALLRRTAERSFP